jgi:hypothetical protein
MGPPVVEKEEAMADSAYHTNSAEYVPKNREVYRNNDSCPEGKKIKQEHGEPGPAGRPLCKVC